MARSCAALAGGKLERHPPLDTPLAATAKGVASDVAAVAVSETFDVIIELCPTGAAAWHISLNFLMKLFNERAQKKNIQRNMKESSHIIQDFVMKKTKECQQISLFFFKCI